jgi:GT2 family glycosyltransferase/glycosyltransferase involved in cell wall biosynthesis
MRYENFYNRGFSRKYDPLNSLLHLKKNPDVITNAAIQPRQGVSVVLPVYRDVEMTEACIEAAIPGILTVNRALLVIVNDDSPDPGMNSMLHEKAAQWPLSIKLLANDRNLGFVASANRGMRLIENQDTALLNSDVIVPPDWLIRLQEEAYSRPEVATVTPLSNNTTICTFPEFLQDNSVPFGLGVTEVDNIFRYSRLPNVETPTGVGFCMYIRWDCLKMIGYFDEDRFGRGYGEENEFCQRAIKKGWCNLVTPNLYVYHKGGASFGADKAALVASAKHVMDKIYPNYHSDVQEFIGRNPLRESRLIRLADLLASVQVPKILHISHGIGGGVDQHIEELAEYLYPTAFSLMLAPKNCGGQAVLRFGFRKAADEVVLNLPDNYQSLVSLLHSLEISFIHYHHVLNVHPLFYELPRDLGVKHYLTVHDYYLLNGNPTLTDEHGLFSSSSDIDKLNNALCPLPSNIGPEEWREKHRFLVQKAECVIFPTAAARALFGGFYKIEREILAPHVEVGFRNVDTPPKRFPVKTSYVIGVLGALGREKGADYLEEIARAAIAAGHPLAFVLIGYAYRPLDAVTVTGPYCSIDLPDLLEKHNCDVIFFPARCPETYSYTLSAALQSALPIIAAAIGAFPERLSGRKHVMLFAHDMPAFSLLEKLVTFIESLKKGHSHPAPQQTNNKVNLVFYQRDYLLEWEQQRNNELLSGKDFLRQEIIQKLLPNRLTQQRSVREAILYALWRVYIRPEMRWVNTLVPYDARRRVKRWLSDKPLHDIAAGR